MIKLKLLAASLAFSSLAVTSSFAQKPAKFEDILKQKKAQIERQTSNPEKAQKKYERYEWYWQTRLNEDGTLGSLAKSYFDSPILKTGAASSADPADWTVRGPVEFEHAPAWDWQAGITHEQWQGKIDEVYAPADESYTLIASESGGIWKRKTADAGWTNVTDALELPNFNVNSIVADPFDDDHIFAATGGIDDLGYGILESSDGGDTWVVLNDFNLDYCAEYPTECANGNGGAINVLQLKVDPHQSIVPNGVHLYALTRTTAFISDIWKSENSGGDWVKLNAPTLNPNESWRDIEISPSTQLLLTTVENFAAGARYFHHDPIATPSVWNDRTANIMVSASCTNAVRMNLTSPAGSIGQRVFALRDCGNSRDILESVDFGLNWTVIRNIPNASGWGGPHPKDDLEFYEPKDLLYIGGIRLIELDVANTGTSVPLTTVAQGHVDVRDIQFSPQGSNLHIYTANDGGVSKVDFDAGTWEDLNGNYLPVMQFYDIATAQLPQDRIIGGVIHNHVFRLENNSWAKKGAGDGSSAVMDYGTNQYGYVCYGGNISRYDFLSGSLTSILGSGMNGVGANIEQIFIDPVNPEIIYNARLPIASGQNFLNVWDESTDTWTNREVGFVDRIGELAVAKTNTDRMYLADYKFRDGASNNDKLIRTDNGGITGVSGWTSIGAGNVYDLSGTTLLGTLNQFLSYRKVTDIEVDPADEDRLWITISGYVKSGDEKERVLMSLDGGNTWREYSQGLPRIPINSMVYVEGSQDLMFVGTEDGVYYRDASLTQWECFNEGMPRAIITDLDFNYCSMELIAGTHGRAIWKTPIPTDLASIELSSNLLIPTGTTEIYRSDVLVKSGATLYVNGRLEMSADTKIIVEQNARIVMDGGIITSTCDNLWGGIELAGTPSAGQLPQTSGLDPNQATLVMKNGAVLEHAKAAVVTKSNLLAAGGGARIFASNSEFRDNRFDLEMTNYEPANVSTFLEMDFLTTAPLPDPEYVDGMGRAQGTATHVRLWNVHGLLFEQCQFINSGTFDKDLRGIGIASLDADFDVEGECILTAGTGCASSLVTFSNLSEGIEFHSTTGAESMDVTLCQFAWVVQGIMAFGGSDINVVNNQFLDYQGSLNWEPNFMLSVGVYLDGTFGANVASNTFRSAATAATSAFFYPRGVAATNTGGFLTTVDNNVFNAGQMIGVNGWLDNDHLQISCNEFHSEFGLIFDKQFNAGSGNFDPAILPTQGSLTESAGNEFHFVCSDNVHHIYFDGIDPERVNTPPIYNETVLQYFISPTETNFPTCVSNDMSTLQFTDPANPAPGGVMVSSSPTAVSCGSGGGGAERGAQSGNSIAGNTLLATATAVAGGATIQTEALRDLNIDADQRALLALLADLKSAEKSYFEMSAAQLQQLKAIAGNGSRVSLKALAVLDYIGESDFDFDFPEFSFAKASAEAQASLEPNGVVLAPNPASESVQIVFAETPKTMDVKIVNLRGQRVYADKLPGDARINTSNLETGIYFVHVTWKNQVQVMKMIIE